MCATVFSLQIFRKYWNVSMKHGYFPNFYPFLVDLIIFLNNRLESLNHLISNCYFSVENVVMSQNIGIPMGIDPAPFWETFFCTLLNMITSKN